ncbi:MAG: NADH-quinone oxidoreductase subunit NuoG [Actinomycetes bacterium]
MSERPRKIEITDPVEITVDGATVTAQSGELLIDACERAGAYVPRFCYHPRMEPVGMCRMCLVEVDTGRGPALQPSCMLPVTPGMSVDTTGEKVAKAQDGVLEFLLANHPLDCPVCDKGGECPLQDQTVAYGPGESRFVEEKRHYTKPIPISETVFLDRERCILCDRCTRFAKEVAGDPLIHFAERGAQTEVATFPGEPFSSYFSGNTVQICPVGALTAKPYRFKARPWDLEEVESTCTGCSVGCRVTVQSSRNEVLRYQGVDSDPVTWSWLCDKGRFGFEAFNHTDRVGEPLVRVDGSFQATRWSDALTLVVDAVRGAAPERVAVIGGARLTNEGQLAWARLAKSVIGTDHVDAQIGDGLPATVVLDLPGASIDEVCAPGSTVLYLGPDPKEELPVLHLRLRHAALNDGVRIVQVAPTATGLSDFAAADLHPRPGDTAAVVAALVGGDVPADGVGGVTAEQLSAARELIAAAETLRVVVGRQNLAEAESIMVDAVAAVVAAVPSATFLPALRRSNVRGALEAGLTPGRLPGRASLATPGDWSEQWGALPQASGLDTAGILAAAVAGRIDVLVLLGADPLSDFPDRELAALALDAVSTVVAVDPFVNASAARAAQVVLPAAAFGEVDGTTTSAEGRVTTVARKVTPPGTARSDWMIATELAARLGTDFGVASASDLWEAFVAAAPSHAGATTEALADDANVDGVLVAFDGNGFVAPPPTEVPAQNSYSLRVVVNRSLYDNGTLLSHCPSSASLCRPATLVLGPADAESIAVSSGAEVVVTAQRATIRAQVTVAAGVPRGSAVLRHNLLPVDDSGADPGRIVIAGDLVTEIRVEAG